MLERDKKIIHLICNAHLDPVWLWEWEEGVAATISTFRTAAELCEQNHTFVFNHNEAILYEWIQEYAPDLFERIKKLVKKGQWHIMGGWYLQPDCNMPSGESFVRQILLGRSYFTKHFGARPTTAINFDPFGHNRGLVQILAKSGYDSYLFGRPSSEFMPLDSDLFTWVGFDDSEVLAKRFRGWYNTALGKAKATIIERIEQSDDAIIEILWGVGNHGGGPSRKDLADINDLIKECTDVQVRHSTPDAYFSEVSAAASGLPRRANDLNPWAIGCYTSMIRVKQKHRQLENELYMTEKMASAACANQLMTYPTAEFQSASRDLMFAQFHDILPGSSIQPVEEASLRRIDHALEKLSRIKTRAFYALACGSPKAKAGQIPILVYNPHPYPVNDIVECEFQLADLNTSGSFTDVTLVKNGKPVPCQVEKEASNIAADWRKRIAFRATLKPGQMSRFDCILHERRRKPAIRKSAGGKTIRLGNDRLKVVINTRTGLVDQYQVDGVDFVAKGALCPVVLADSIDPWEMNKVGYGRSIGKFKLLSKAVGSKFSGLRDTLLDSVRIIEDGPVRTVVEAVFGYEESFICQQYSVPKEGTELGVRTRVFWNQKDTLLKLQIPMMQAGCSYWGQAAFGTQSLPTNGNEAVAQKWVAVTDEGNGTCLTCINDGIYGSDFSGRNLRLSLLRSPAYSAHPVLDNEVLSQNRFTPRIDQGERIFLFWINGGTITERLKRIGSEAMAKNEKPFALSFFPDGHGKAAKPVVVLNTPVIEMTAMKKAQSNHDWIVRLFNSRDRKQIAQLKLPVFGLKKKLTFGPFEVKTLRIDFRKEISEVNLIEEKP